MRLLPHVLVPVAMAAALACAGGDDDDDDDDDADEAGDDSGEHTGVRDSGDTGVRDSGDTGGVDDEPIAHPTCDAYLACLSDVAPEETAAATEAYGDDSVCWDAEDAASACEAECAAALHQRRYAHPGSEACDDGTDVPSNLVLLQTDWTLTPSAVEGPMCESWFSYVTGFRVSFSPTDTSAFVGVFDASGWTNTLDCVNDGLVLSCYGLDGTYQLAFDGALSDDLASLSGVFADDVYCKWTLESGG